MIKKISAIIVAVSLPVLGMSQITMQCQPGDTSHVHYSGNDSNLKFDRVISTPQNSPSTIVLPYLKSSLRGSESPIGTITVNLSNLGGIFGTKNIQYLPHPSGYFQSTQVAWNQFGITENNYKSVKLDAVLNGDISISMGFPYNLGTCKSFLTKIKNNNYSPTLIALPIANKSEIAIYTDTSVPNIIIS